MSSKAIFHLHWDFIESPKQQSQVASPNRIVLKEKIDNLQNCDDNTLHDSDTTTKSEPIVPEETNTNGDSANQSQS